MAVATYRWICKKNRMQKFSKRTLLFTKRTLLFTKRIITQQSWSSSRSEQFCSPRRSSREHFCSPREHFLFTKKTFLFIYEIESWVKNWTKIWEWLKRKTCKKLHAKSHQDKNHLNRLSFVTCHLVCGPIDHYVCNEWLLWALLNNSNKSLKRIVLEIS